LRKFCLVCTLSASALLICAAVAFAAGVPVSPALKATVDTPHPTFSWTVPAGEKVSDILISQTNHNDHGFLDRAIDDHQVTGKTSYAYAASILIPGTYYWQLSGLNAAGQPAMSKIQSFVVPAIVKFNPVKPHWNPIFPDGRPVDYFVTTIRCNFDHKPTVELKVFQGKKLLSTDSFVGHDCVDMHPYAFADTFQKPVTMPKGTRLTAQFLVKYDKWTVESPLTPFQAH
jgi:hypothetical protein